MSIYTLADELNARWPVLIRVLTTDGEIIEHVARSLRAAQGWLAHCVAEGYWYGKPHRVEYEFWAGYRWE